MKAGLPSLSEPGAAPRILVVDDDPDILRTVQMTLEIEGFEIGTAGGAPEAKEWISHNGLPHLGIIDDDQDVLFVGIRQIRPQFSIRTTDQSALVNLEDTFGYKPLPDRRQADTWMAFDASQRTAYPPRERRK